MAYDWHISAFLVMILAGFVIDDGLRARRRAHFDPASAVTGLGIATLLFLFVLACLWMLEDVTPLVIGALLLPMMGISVLGMVSHFLYMRGRVVGIAAAPVRLGSMIALGAVSLWVYVAYHFLGGLDLGHLMHISLWGVVSALTLYCAIQSLTTAYIERMLARALPASDLEWLSVEAYHVRTERLLRYGVLLTLLATVSSMNHYYQRGSMPEGMADKIWIAAGVLGVFVAPLLMRRYLRIWLRPQHEALSFVVVLAVLLLLLLA